MINQIRNFVNSLKDDGKFMTVTFIKKDGSIGKLNCKKGAWSSGKGIRQNPDQIRVITGKGDKRGANKWRSFNLNRLISIKADGQEIIFKNVKETEKA